MALTHDLDRAAAGIINYSIYNSKVQKVLKLQICIKYINILYRIFYIAYLS